MLYAVMRDRPLPPNISLGQGLAWDRQWMVVDGSTGKFLTQRQEPRLAVVRAARAAAAEQSMRHVVHGAWHAHGAALSGAVPAWAAMLPLHCPAAHACVACGPACGPARPPDRSGPWASHMQKTA